MEIQKSWFKNFEYMISISIKNSKFHPKAINESLTWTISGRSPAALNNSIALRPMKCWSSHGLRSVNRSSSPLGSSGIVKSYLKPYYESLYRCFVSWPRNSFWRSVTNLYNKWWHPEKTNSSWRHEKILLNLRIWRRFFSYLRPSNWWALLPSPSFLPPLGPTKKRKKVYTPPWNFDRENEGLTILFNIPPPGNCIQKTQWFPTYFIIIIYLQQYPEIQFGVSSLKN